MSHASHEHTDVVRVGGRHPDVETYPAHDAADSVEHVDSVTVDPHARRVAAAHRINQAIYLLFGFIEILIGIRLILKMLGANPASPFAASLYAITSPFLAPFAGIFPRLQYPGGIFEPEAVLAIVMLMLLAWLLTRVVWLLLNDSDYGVARSTRAYRSRRP
jgi:uncharacterized protein YggT (Ycf19 family)